MSVSDTGSIFSLGGARISTGALLERSQIPAPTPLQRMTAAISQSNQGKGRGGGGDSGTGIARGNSAVNNDPLGRRSLMAASFVVRSGLPQP